MSVDIARIEKHCAHKDMYDDDGYCDNRIRRLGVYYVRVTSDNNMDCNCPECMLQMVIADDKRDFQYVDLWMEDFERITHAFKARQREVNVIFGCKEIGL